MKGILHITSDPAYKGNTTVLPSRGNTVKQFEETMRIAHTGLIIALVLGSVSVHADPADNATAEAF